MRNVRPAAGSQKHTAAASMSKAIKVKNPEAALQASVKRDIKLRQMDEAVRVQAGSLAIARWENALGQKDAIALKKRAEQDVVADSKLANQNVRQNRKAKLEALYFADELKYEEELAMSGLAFRRDRA